MLRAGVTFLWSCFLNARTIVCYCNLFQLEPTKNLVSQCVQGSGMVQINVEVKSQPGVKPRLNIVDILKPAEEIVEAPLPGIVLSIYIQAPKKKLTLFT